MKTITEHMLEELRQGAAVSPRRRLNLNLHPTLGDPIQRFFNAMEPDSYVRPHRHVGADRWELFIAVSGSAAVLSFDPQGVVLDRTEMAACGPVRGAEIPGGTWHAVVSLEPGTVLLEVKRGPYQKASDKDFAAWAPREGEPAVAVFVAWYRSAVAGSRPPSA